MWKWPQGSFHLPIKWLFIVAVLTDVVWEAVAVTRWYRRGSQESLCKMVSMYFKKPTDLQRQEYCMGPSHVEYYCIQDGTTLEPLLRFTTPVVVSIFITIIFKAVSFLKALQMIFHPRFVWLWSEITAAMIDWHNRLCRLHKLWKLMCQRVDIVTC